MTSNQGMTEAARALVESRLDSVEMVEVLLLLHADRERCWTVDEVAGASGLDTVTASRHLILLRQRGLLTVAMGGDASYTYGAQGELAGAVDDLMECYRTRPMELASVMAARPRQKLRLFADAFRLRRDK
jgi:hypothetical protein